MWQNCTLLFTEITWERKSYREILCTIWGRVIAVLLAPQWESWPTSGESARQMGDGRADGTYCPQVRPWAFSGRSLFPDGESSCSWLRTLSPRIKISFVNTLYPESCYGHIQIHCLDETDLTNRCYQVIKALPQSSTVFSCWGAGPVLCAPGALEKVGFHACPQILPQFSENEVRQNSDFIRHQGCLKSM